MKKKSIFLLVSLLIYFLIISGCEQKSAIKSDIEQQTESTANAESTTSSSAVTTTEVPTTVEKTTPTVAKPHTIQLDDIPPYSGTAYIEINGNFPFFTPDDYTTSSYEYYSDLDSLGRCGVAYACVGKDLLPTEKRGAIGMVKPSGWHTVRYDDLISDKYLYNRCHLIAYELSGENANEKNLITGTRYMNIEGMLPFENKVHDYVESTGNHVLYRSTPIFKGDNLVANGVLLEGLSIEDNGHDISFSVYCYNVQPGIDIDYSTGDSSVSENNTSNDSPNNQQSEEKQNTDKSKIASTTYILNTNSKKFHRPNCSSVLDMKEKNKLEFVGSREKVIEMGYSPCGRSKP